MAFESIFKTRRLHFKEISFKAYVSQIDFFKKKSLNVFTQNTTILNIFFYKSLNQNDF
jgi:hypothetical protein